MSSLVDRAKLVRAHQYLLESSAAYDKGCMEIKELLDSVPEDGALLVRLQRLRHSADRVTWYDWSGSDSDASLAIADLRNTLAESSDGGLLAHNRSVEKAVLGAVADYLEELGFHNTDAIRNRPTLYEEK